MPQTAFIMSDLMRWLLTKAQDRLGKVLHLRVANWHPDDFCDNWFVGFTPQITAGVWV